MSPEFGAGAGEGPPRLNGVVGGNSGGRSSGTFLGSTGDAIDQAAPLYTVNAARAESDIAIVARSSPLTDSMLLGKRMTVADAGCLSVGALAATTARVPVGFKGVHPKPDKVPPPRVPSGQIEASGVVASPLRSPEDVSPLVTDAICTWGQELRTILGQTLPHSASPASRKDVCCSSRRPGLTTTGHFPQIMILR